MTQRSLALRFAAQRPGAAWRAFLAALFGLDIGEDVLATFTECTSEGATYRAGKGGLAGLRPRAGKSFILAWSPCSSPASKTGVRSSASVSAAPSW